MKLVDTITLNGSSNPATLVTRFRQIADFIEASVASQAALGGVSPSVPVGNDIALQIKVESTRP